jgi:hypothetical protein
LTRHWITTGDELMFGFGARRRTTAQFDIALPCGSMRGMRAWILVLAACGGAPRTITPTNSAAPAREPVVATEPDAANTWIDKLRNPREVERAVSALEQLGDPSAIPALGEAWAQQGQSPRILAAIVELARPLKPDQAKAQLVTHYQSTGRPASWDRALPILIRAVSELDEVNPRSVDSATKAADALGEARLPEAIDALVVAAHRPTTKRVIVAQVAAIRALGTFASDKQRVATALVKLIDREPPQHPRTAKTKDEESALEEAYALFLGTTGAAINAIAALRTPIAIDALVLSMYRTPELFMQIRRALVASGPTSQKQLTAVLRREHAEVEKLFAARHLDRYCSDTAPCQLVSARDFYAAIVLGDLYDPASVPTLLAALKRPALPPYYIDDQPAPSTQYNAIFDALRKIGAPDAAAPVRAMWKAKDLKTRILAVATYPFVSRDVTGLDVLGKIAADNGADDNLRQEAATAFARIAHDAKDIALLQSLATRYLDASAKKAKDAAALKSAVDAADAVYETKRADYDAAREHLLATTRDTTKTADEIRAETGALQQLQDELRAARKTHKEKVAPFKALDAAARAYLGYARMFQTHIARIEIAIRCKTDLACYAAALKLDADQVVANNVPYIPDVTSWSPDDKRELAAAASERAMLELGKAGQKATAYTDALLDAAVSDHRLVRQSVLLALPKIAKLPCENCEAKLDAAINASEGKTLLADLELETIVLRNYFTWAGGRSPAPTGD